MSVSALADHAFSFRLLDTDVRIECSDPRWVRLVRRLWAPFASEQSARPLRIAIEAAETGWRIQFPDRPTPTFADAWSLVVNLVHELDERVLPQASGVQDVHAAVVARDGVALLLAGPSGASKTSIALELLRLGWVYLSDDRALIRRTTGKVMPFPKPPGIKDAKEWPRYRGGWDSAGWPPPPTGTFSVPASAVGTVAEEDATPRFMIFPRFERGNGLEFAEESPGHAVARASQYVRTLSPDAVRTLARLGRETQAASLIHGNSRRAARLLDRWVKHSLEEGNGEPT